jgi:predicted NBD/HSP70 family sugar kinase
MVAETPAGGWRWPELHDAQRTVLLEVLVHGSRSRADLTRRTGLSRSSLSRLTRDLAELGLVVEGRPSQPNGRGRPSEVLHLVPDAAFFVGVKLTGDALYAVVTDLHGKVVLAQDHRLPSRRVDAVVELIGEVVRGMRRRYSRIASVGVCLAGDVLAAGARSVVVGSNFLGWDEVGLEELVAAATGLPVAISNDVQALTVAHHWFGAGVGCSSLAVISFGAGIGVGLVVGDQLVGGAHGHPGKVGHLRVRDDGPMCDRGHHGCVAAYVTVPSVVANAGAADLESALARAEAGEAAATRAVGDAAFALGVVIAHLANLVDPEKIVVTGEGLAIAHGAPEQVDAGIAARLDPASGPVEVEYRTLQFADYARAAAISAIRRVV